ncbi:MAG: stage V sporulation protein AE [Halanaerobiales bacterium]|nr:stage V sporulation protein AE [Halanaerobiales bacterium]
MGQLTKIIVITDGDELASKAVCEAGKRLNLRTISASAGNPTPLKGEELVGLIKKAKSEPVLVMVDDCGHPGKGQGEDILDYLNSHHDIEILGVVAVAANVKSVEGVEVDFSIDCNGNIVKVPVDKEGVPEAKSHTRVEGDTVDVLNEINVPVIIGIGDIGKMNGRDSFQTGARITTKAIEEILSRSGVYEKATH